MPVLTIRGLDQQTTKILKRRAAEEGISVNGLVLRAIRQSLGFEKQKGRVYSDLDHLAGTWSEKEFREFEKNTSAFENIDEKLWR